MNRLLVVPTAVLLALPLSVAALAQDTTQTPPPMAHDSMSRSTSMSHGGAMAPMAPMAHDSMGHGSMSHDTMGHGAMTRAMPDKMSAPGQPK